MLPIDDFLGIQCLTVLLSSSFFVNVIRIVLLKIDGCTVFIRIQGSEMEFHYVTKYKHYQHNIPLHTR